MPGTNAFYFISALDTPEVQVKTAPIQTYLLHAAANFVGTVLDEWRTLRPSLEFYRGNLSSFIRPATLVAYREAHRPRT